MLFDTDSEHGIVYDPCYMVVEFGGEKWYEVMSEKALPTDVTIHYIGRMGMYHFYIDENLKRYVIIDWTYV